METIKCVLIGDPFIGKTWLITTYVTGRNPIGHISSLFAGFNKIITVGTKKYNMVLWDITFREECDRLRNLVFSDVDVFLACYAVNSMFSFKNVRKSIKKLEKYDVPIILCGTKCDMIDEDTIDENLFGALSGDHRIYGYVKCSSVEFTNMKKVFYMAAEAAVRHRKSMPRVFWFCYKYCLR